MVESLVSIQVFAMSHLRSTGTQISLTRAGEHQIYERRFGCARPSVAACDFRPFSIAAASLDTDDLHRQETSLGRTTRCRL